MKTIGIDASRANVRHRTGTEWYCFHLLHELVKRIPKNDYHVVLYVKEPLVEDMQALAQHWEVRVLRWPPGLLWTQLRLSLHLWRRRTRPDVLFIPAHTIPIIHPQHTVYVAHDLGFERQPALYANTYIGGWLMHLVVKIFTLGRYGASELDYHRWSMQFAARTASKIIAISEFTKRELQHFYHVPDSRIAVVHNGYNPVKYVTDDMTGPRRDLFLYIGRIEHKKNIVHLVEGFAQYKRQNQNQLKLCLIGQLGYGQEEIVQTIRRHRLADDVLLPGYVAQTDLVNYWRRTLGFVFPTNYEGFGIPILEAMAANTIVACSDIEPLHEVGGEACIYFDQTSPVAIARALEQLVTLTSMQRANYLAAGYKRIRLFSWERCAAQTWQVIKGQLN